MVVGFPYHQIELHINILKEIPDFDLNLAFEDIDLIKFNNFVVTYASLELKSGTLGVFYESVVKDRAIESYVKPIIEDFDVAQGGEDKNLPEKVYEAVVDFFAGVVENLREEQIASKVEISGTVVNIENYHGGFCLTY